MQCDNEHVQHRTVNAIKFRWNDKLKKRLTATEPHLPLQVPYLLLLFPNISPVCCVILTCRVWCVLLVEVC